MTDWPSEQHWSFDIYIVHFFFSGHRVSVRQVLATPSQALPSYTSDSRHKLVTTYHPGKSPLPQIYFYSVCYVLWFLFWCNHSGITRTFAVTMATCSSCPWRSLSNVIMVNKIAVIFKVSPILPQKWYHSDWYPTLYHLIMISCSWYELSLFWPVCACDSFIFSSTTVTFDKLYQSHSA